MQVAISCGCPAGARPGAPPAKRASIGDARARLVEIVERGLGERLEDAGRDREGMACRVADARAGSVPGVRTSLKSIRWTWSPDAASAPNTLVRPRAHGYARPCR